MEVVDLVRFNSQGKIAQIKEFLDSGHIQKHVERHENEQAKKSSKLMSAASSERIEQKSCIGGGIRRARSSSISDPSLR